MAVKTKRQSYGRLKNVYDIPNLIKIQLDSYENFLQLEEPKTKRKKQGLEGVLQEVFPIEAPGGNVRLEYVYYDIGKPKYDV